MTTDSRAFACAGLGESYENIGQLNLFMVCETPNAQAFSELPPKYSMRLCRHDELEKWMHTALQKEWVSVIAGYYARVYAPRAEEFFSRCTFVCNADNEPVATGFLWQAYNGKVNTLHWVRTMPEYEGCGLGRALLSHLLTDARCPVYLHTQPSSACAIKLYSDMGFALVTNPTIGHRKNNLDESLPVLQQVMPAGDYANLRFVEINDTLHQAALTNEFSEF